MTQFQAKPGEKYWSIYMNHKGLYAIPTIAGKNPIEDLEAYEGHNMYKTEKDALDLIGRIKEIMFGAPTDRQMLEAENTEYDYGHNVKHHSEE